MTKVFVFALIGVLSAAPSKPPQKTVLLALAVETAAGRVRVDTDQPAPAAPAAGPRAARPTARARVGELLSIRWFAENRDPKQPLQDTIFHFLVTREDQPGQELPRQPTPGSVADNSYATDLAPRASTTGTCKIPIAEPGTYLVQFETLDRTATRRDSCSVEVRVE